MQYINLLKIKFNIYLVFKYFLFNIISECLPLKKNAMAEKEIAFKVSVDTGNTVNDVDNITQTIGGVGAAVQEEFGSLRTAIKQASADVDELSSKFGENSKEADHARKSLASLNMTYDELAKSNVDLGASFEDVYGEVQPLTARMGELEDRMFELALAGKKDTDEFKALRDEVVRYQKVIEDTTREIDALKQRGANMQAALQLGEAVVAGYTAFQSVTAMLGVENEALLETISKLEAAQGALAAIESFRMALEKDSILMLKLQVLWTNIQSAASNKLTIAQIAQNGVTAIFTAVTSAAAVAMGVLNAVMLLNPVFLLIAAFAAIAGALVLFSSSTDHAEEDNEALNISLARTNELLEIQNETMVRAANNRLKQAQAEGASEEELLQKRLAVMQAEETARQKNLSQIRKEIKARSAIRQLAILEDDEETAKAANDELNKLYSKYKKMRSLDGQFYADRKREITQYNREQAEEAQKEAEKLAEEAKKAAEESARKAKERRERLQKEREEAERKRLEYERLIADLSVANIEDEWQRKFTAQAVAQERERQDLISKYGNDTKLLAELQTKQRNELFALDQEQMKAEQAKIDEAEKKQAERDYANYKAQIEGELIQAKEDFEVRMELQEELALLERNHALENKELTEGEKFKIEQEYASKVDDLNKQRADNEKATNEAIAASRRMLVDNVATAFGALAEVTKKNSNAQKAFAIAQIAIQTATGFIDGLRLAQKAALETPTPIGKALVFTSFAATQFAAVMKARQQAQAIIGAGGASVSPPSVSAGSAGSSNPTGIGQDGTSTDGLTGNNNQKTQVVLPVDSFTKVAGQMVKVVDLNTVG